MKRLIISLCIVLIAAGCGSTNNHPNKTTGNEESKEATTSSVDISNFKTSLDVKQEADKVTFHIKFTNEGEEDADVTFSSGQKYELVVTNEKNEEVYRYSTGKMFTMALETVKLTPGQGLDLTDEWDYMMNGEKVAPGEYKATVTVIPKEINKIGVDEDHFIQSTNFTISSTNQISTIQSDRMNENSAFRNVKTSGTDGEYTITGEARVFEATFFYSVEDGHEVLIPETLVQAKEGAPEWSQFEIKISLAKEKLPKNGTVTASIYERSANDDSVVNTIHVPLQQFK